MSWITLDRVVRDICRLRNDPGAKMYPKVATAVSRAIDQFQLASFPCVRTLDFVLDNQLTAPLPDGLAVVLKVGVQTGTGITIARELDSMELNFRRTEIDRDLGCEEDVVVAQATGPSGEGDLTGSAFFNYYNDRNESFGEFYGTVPADNRPCYSVDYKGCRIVFDSTGVKEGDTVLIMSSLYPGAGEEAEIMIPRDAFDMIYHWANAYLEDAFSPGLANNFRVNSGNAKKIFDRRHGGWSLEDIYIYYRGGYTPSVK